MVGCSTPCSTHVHTNGKSHSRHLRLVSVRILVPLGTREFLSPAAAPVAAPARAGGWLTFAGPPNKNSATRCVVAAGVRKYSELSMTMICCAVKAVRKGSSWYAYSPRSSRDLFRRYLEVARAGHGEMLHARSNVSQQHHVASSTCSTHPGVFTLHMHAFVR